VRPAHTGRDGSNAVAAPLVPAWTPTASRLICRQSAVRTPARVEAFRVRATAVPPRRSPGTRSERAVPSARQDRPQERPGPCRGRPRLDGGHRPGERGASCLEGRVDRGPRGRRRGEPAAAALDRAGDEDASHGRVGGPLSRTVRPLAVRPSGPCRGLSSPAQGVPASAPPGTPKRKFLSLTPEGPVSSRRLPLSHCRGWTGGGRRGGLPKGRAVVDVRRPARAGPWLRGARPGWRGACRAWRRVLRPVRSAFRTHRR